jgi:hypothetical protein
MRCSYRWGVLYAPQLVRRAILRCHGSSDNRIEIVHEGILAQELRAPRGMPFLVPRT